MLQALPTTYDDKSNRSISDDFLNSCWCYNDNNYVYDYDVLHDG